MTGSRILMLPAAMSIFRRRVEAKDVLGDGDVLTAHDLKTKRAVSLGQTLAKVGGVQNAGFGPNTG
ncbi:hypothetical protein ACRPFF_11190, partial [Neisseria sp. SLRRB23]|uniref:hypothetical protein n=1 Tax=Neisseria sp. SLRRB23 TaxID=3435199 RepID=UPI003D7FEC79